MNVSYSEDVNEGFIMLDAVFLSLFESACEGLWPRGYKRKSQQTLKGHLAIACTPPKRHRWNYIIKKDNKHRKWDTENLNENKQKTEI